MTQAPASNSILTNIIQNLPVNGSIRSKAAEVLSKEGLPNNKHEEYKYIPLTRTLEKNFNFTSSKNESSDVKDISSLIIHNMESHRVVMVNGEFNEQLSAFDKKDINLEILDANEESEKLGSLADFHRDGFVAWNTAAWTTCIKITVANNQELAKPVVIHHISDTTNGQSKFFNRLLIELGSNSKLTLIEKQDSAGGNSNPGFSNIVTEAFVGENSELNFYSVQADAGNRYHFGQTSIWQDRNSRVNSFILTLNGKLIRNNLQIIMDGDGCESHLNGLYLVGGDTLVDNHTVVDHKKPNTYSNELYKGVIGDNAKSVFNGKIFVRPHAQKTNAFQSNRNILLSDNATVNTKPQLEIWADDVKCSHGCTTGQLDEEALFYLQSRGIDKETAQAMVLYAFATEVLGVVKSEVLKKYLDELISKRLHKHFD